MMAIKRMVLLVAILLGCALPVFAEDAVDTVLLWWVNDDPDNLMVTDTDGHTQLMIKQIVGRGDAAEKTVNAVRVLALTGETPTQLQIKTPEMDDWFSYLGLPDGDGGYNAGPAYANLTGLDVSSNPDLEFMIELGNLSDDGWTTLAVSEIAAASALSDFIRSAQLAQYTELEWTPTFTVPEPTSGMLLLIGCGLLALRRRERAMA